MMEGSFIKVLNLFPKGVKIFFYSLLISDCNLASKRVQGETRLQEGVLRKPSANSTHESAVAAYFRS